MVFEFLRKKQNTPASSEVPQAASDTEALAAVQRRVEKYYQSQQKTALGDDPVAQAMASITEDKEPALEVPPSETKVPASLGQLPPQPHTIIPPRKEREQTSIASPDQSLNRPIAQNTEVNIPGPSVVGDAAHLTRMRRETQAASQTPTLDERIDVLPLNSGADISETTTKSHESGEDIISDTTDAIADFMKRDGMYSRTSFPDVSDQGNEVTGDILSSSHGSLNDSENVKVDSTSVQPTEERYGGRIKSLLTEVPGEFDRDSVIRVLRRVSDDFLQLDTLLDGVYTREGKYASDMLKEKLSTEARKEALGKAVRQISVNDNTSSNAEVA
ncbi:hypothetical protein CL652_00955 [bacterium]|mgnify:CR=1 FL=1|nr:hypothetical protein [bacterium]|tara:strand:+ start:18049 stop:19038 length:990 start_codon:yes stop_codon:yes gene_type:complete